MGTFSYIARDSAGQRVTGQLAAATEQAVVAELQARQLAPVRVKAVAGRAGGGLSRGLFRGQFRGRGRVGTRHLAGAYRQIADLLRAGVPLLRALRLVGSSKAHPRLAAVMSSIADAVAEGDRLADAMAVHDDVFPPIQLAMVRAGERGGFLEPVLARLGDFLEHQSELKTRVVGSLIYPVLLLIVSVVIVVAALVLLVPRFAALYARVELPLATRMLFGVSDMIVRGWPVLLAAAAIGAMVIWRMRTHAELRRRMAAWQLRLPFAGGLMRNLAVARLTRVLGTLLGNGVPLLAAMQISRDAAGHVLMAEAVDAAAESVRAGEPLARPLAASGLFDDDVIEMISVGETANNLPDVLVTIAQTVERRVDRILMVLLRLLEPVLLLALGAVAVFIFIALIVPMMRMSASLG